jgi:hypothetical protein
MFASVCSRLSMACWLLFLSGTRARGPVSGRAEILADRAGASLGCCGHNHPCSVSLDPGPARGREWTGRGGGGKTTSRRRARAWGDGRGCCRADGAGAASERGDAPGDAGKTELSEILLGAWSPAVGRPEQNAQSLVAVTNRPGWQVLQARNARRAGVLNAAGLIDIRAARPAHGVAPATGWSPIVWNATATARLRVADRPSI